MKPIPEQEFLSGWAKQHEEWEALREELQSDYVNEGIVTAAQVSLEQQRRRMLAGECMFRMIGEIPHEVTPSEDAMMAKLANDYTDGGRKT